MRCPDCNSRSYFIFDDDAYICEDCDAMFSSSEAVTSSIQHSMSNAEFIGAVLGIIFGIVLIRLVF
jgi:hypothetical protein